MFRIEVFVQDDKLAAVLHALSGMVMNLDVQPVANAVVQNGKVQAETGGTLVELFGPYLNDHPEPVTVDYVRSFLVSAGRSPTSYQHLLKEALKAKLITKRGKGTGMSYSRAKK
jgi:hypothetical protein